MNHFKRITGLLDWDDFLKKKHFSCSLPEAHMWVLSKQLNWINLITLHKNCFSRKIHVILEQQTHTMYPFKLNIRYNSCRLLDPQQSFTNTNSPTGNIKSAYLLRKKKDDNVTRHVSKTTLIIQIGFDFLELRWLVSSFLGFHNDILEFVNLNVLLLLLIQKEYYKHYNEMYFDVVHKILWIV